VLPQAGEDRETEGLPPIMNEVVDDADARPESCGSKSLMAAS
jgi:hypothetical protein